MDKDIDFKNLDRRVIDRFLKRGELTEKDLEKHLKGLPNLEEESAVVEARFEARAGTPGGQA